MQERRLPALRINRLVITAEESSNYGPSLKPLGLAMVDAATGFCLRA